MNKRVNIKTLALLLIAAATMRASAQDTGRHYFQAGQVFELSELKAATQAVIDLDPMANVFSSDDLRVIQVNSAQLSEAEIRSAITGTGLTLLPGTPDLTALYGPAPTVPMYIDTGDPQADHARYVQDVEEWNLNNPDNQQPQPLPYVDEQ